MGESITSAIMQRKGQDSLGRNIPTGGRRGFTGERRAKELGEEKMTRVAENERCVEERGRNGKCNKRDTRWPAGKRLKWQGEGGSRKQVQSEKGKKHKARREERRQAELESARRKMESTREDRERKEQENRAQEKKEEERKEKERQEEKRTERKRNGKEKRDERQKEKKGISKKDDTESGESEGDGGYGSREDQRGRWSERGMDRERNEQGKGAGKVMGSGKLEPIVRKRR